MYLVRVILAALLLSVLPASAVVLDWSSVSWTPGSLSQSFDVDADGLNDVTVSFSGDTSAFAAGSPAIASSTLGADLDFSGTSGAITVTVTFIGCLAADLSFSLYDIDADRKGNSSNFAYQDYIGSFTGQGEKGSVIPSVTTGSLVSYTNGSGVGLDVSAPGSSAGNVDAIFDQPLYSYQFTYGSSSNIAGNNPDAQDFAITSIKFRKVPEVGTSTMAALLCFAAALVIRLRKRFSKQALGTA
ncbi:MAG: hypothetical protein K0Q55_2459 [Verrucomicrobia bacterium]|nr:hypothetical protein [Verrucomicrobiota bacterium]